jgi:hypothetical protein
MNVSPKQDAFAGNQHVDWLRAGANVELQQKGAARSAIAKNNISGSAARKAMVRLNASAKIDRSACGFGVY